MIAGMNFIDGQWKPSRSGKTFEQRNPADLTELTGLHQDSAIEDVQDAGAAAVMPLGAPIGTNQGVLTKFQVEIIIKQARVPVVVDAGLGAPSHAAEAMEMGADAVLANTAVATAGDPAKLAKAFSMAVEAGRLAYLSNMPRPKEIASASSPLTGFLYNDIKP